MLACVYYVRCFIDKCEIQFRIVSVVILSLARLFCRNKARGHKAQILKAG
jgi:hypothetical protein